MYVTVKYTIPKRRATREHLQRWDSHPSVLCHWEIWAKILKHQREVTKWVSFLRMSREFMGEITAFGSVERLGKPFRVSRPLSLYLENVTRLGLKQVFTLPENIPADC